MGFITSRRLAATNPAFLVETSRIVVREFPLPSSSRVGVLKNGDIAVVTEDLDNLPWVTLPVGSLIRDAQDTDIFQELEEEAFFCVSRLPEEVEDNEEEQLKPQRMAVRCPEGSAAVHLHTCRCHHWRVVQPNVALRTHPSEESFAMYPFSEGDLICPGPSVNGAPVLEDAAAPPHRSAAAPAAAAPQDKRWLRFGPDAVVWSRERLNDSPSPVSSMSGEDRFAMKVDKAGKKLLVLVKQKRPPDRSAPQDKALAGDEAAAPKAGATSSAPSTAPPPKVAAAATPGLGSCSQCGTSKVELARAGDGKDYCNRCMSSWCGVPEGMLEHSLMTAQIATGGLHVPQKQAPAPVHAEHQPKVPPQPLEFHEGDEDHPSNVTRATQEAIRAQIAQHAIPAATAAGPHAADGAALLESSARAWLVVFGPENRGVRSATNLSAPLLLRLAEHDVLVSWGGPAPQSESMWINFKAGDQIYRRGKALATVRAEQVHVTVCDLDGTELLQPWDWRGRPTTISIESLSGFGIPWQVAHEQVVMRSEPMTTAHPLGLAHRDDIVGASSSLHDWVQLVPNADSRLRGCDSAQPLKHLVNGCHGVSAWMLTKHPTMGELLRRKDTEQEPVSLQTPKILISPGRLGVYRRVTELCHRRIWADNLHSLWEGDSSKLPRVETLEAKLFRDRVTVLHARKGGRFVGGAILQAVSVDIKKGPPAGKEGLAVEKPAQAEPEETDSPRSSSSACGPHAWVGYVDCCATEPGAHVGKALWSAICDMGFLIVALHTVLLPETFNFWKARGMKRVDPSEEGDRLAFSQSVHCRSQGRMHLELADLAAALPHSALPLFVWENCNVLETWTEQAKPPEAAQQRRRDRDSSGGVANGPTKTKKQPVPSSRGSSFMRQKTA